MNNSTATLCQNFGSPPRTSSRCGNHITAAAVSNQSKFKHAGEIMTKMVPLPVQQKEQAPDNQHFNQKQLDILKNSICKGVTNDEFEVFLMACTKTQLDPFMKQIYAIKRKCKKSDGTWGESMTIQTSIDGYRLIAERTGRYAPGPEPTYVSDDKGNLIASTAYIKKMTMDGTWHTVSASAYLSEYMQTYKDKNTGQQIPTGLWINMPRTMLAKCAESQALRKAFPAEMSGVYTKEEMEQADQADLTLAVEKVEFIEKISQDEIDELEMILNECDEKYIDVLFRRLNAEYKVDKLSNIPMNLYSRVKDAATKNMEKNHASQREKTRLEAGE